MSFDADATTALLKEAVAQNVFPGAVLLVADRATPLYLEAIGDAQVKPKVRPATIETKYDLASLTKPIATTTLCMSLHERGLLDLAAPVKELLPEFAHDTPRVRDLLSHSSGLPPHRPFWQYADANSRESIFRLASKEPVEYVPRTESRYSDVGFLVLGWVLERCSGKTLDPLFAPFASDLLGFGPAPGSAATEQIADGTCLAGIVHDENARAMGGIAPHAGLFGTAMGIHRFLCDLTADRIVSEKTRRLFWTNAGIPGSSWCLGWDSPSPHGYSAAGTRLPRTAVGHLAFTGCSLWLDPARPFWILLLSNRIHPSRENDRIRAFRPRLHDAVCAATGIY